MGLSTFICGLIRCAELCICIRTRIWGDHLKCIRHISESDLYSGQLFLKCLIYRRGQHFAVDCILPISFVLHLKLTSTVILKELFGIEKCAICRDTFLRSISSKILELTVCKIIKINKKVYMSVKYMPNKLYLTDAKSCKFSKLCLGSI